ncbi:MAG: LapA family protein [Aquisalinus sp.]|nr:LapA family protein [Aquisalinus sp.]
MSKFLFSTFLLLFGLIFLVFLVANREPVMISLDPLSTEDPAFAFGPLPLWAALVMTLFIGYVFGGVGMWLSGKHTRKKASERKQEIKRLKREIAATAKAQSRPPARTESDNQLPAVQQQA